MKKLILLSTFCLLFSCTKTPEQREREKQNDAIYEQTKMIECVTNFKHNGHKYIVFYNGRGQNSTMGVVHDPDCECLKTK